MRGQEAASEEDSAYSSQLFLHDSTAFDQYAEIQADLLGRGKEVEYFIQENEDLRGTEPCFRLLSNLFSLFKSEFATNIALRKKLKTNETVLTNFAANKATIRSLGASLGKDPALDQISVAVGNLASKNLFDDRVAETALSKLDSLKSSVSSKLNELDDVNSRLDRLKTGDESVEGRREFLHRLETEETSLKEQISALQDEKYKLEATANDSSEGLSDLVDSIKDKMEETVRNARAVVHSEKREISRMRDRVRRLRTDIKDRIAEKCDIEKQLDAVNKQIDFLTDPIAISKNNGVKSAHLVRYDVANLQRKCESLEQDLEDEITEVENLDNSITSVRSRLSDLQSSSQNEKIVIAGLQSECARKKEFLQQMIESRRKIRAARQELSTLDMTRRHAIAKRARLKHLLDDTRTACRELEITGNSLLQSSSTLSSEHDGCTRSLSKATLSDADRATFDSIIDAFRHIRTKLNLPPETTPRDILNLCKTFH